MKFVTLLFICLLTHTSTVALQTPTKKLVVVFSDDQEVELTDWRFIYRTPEMDSRVIAEEYERFNRSLPPLSDEERKKLEKEGLKIQRIPNKSSNNLMLSLSPLNSHGVTLGNIEITEAQLTSIKFTWDKSNYGDLRLKKVNVLSTDGKSIELPYLSIPSLYSGISLVGKTTIRGFVGDFSAKLDDTIVKANSAYIVEIKFK